MSVDINAVVSAVGVIGGMGMLLGAGLGIAGKVLAVEEDERIALVTGALPGANCGGCGYTGCEALARAIVDGIAKPNECPVGGEKSTVAVSEIMGVEAVFLEKQVAFIRCGGSTKHSEYRYDYDGQNDCYAIKNLVGGGSKSCNFGCLGGGTCAKVCQFGAIDIVDGIAVINKEKCTACGICLQACPKTLITLVPYENLDHVACLSFEPGKVVRKICSVGCIGCGLCEKACDAGAIKMEKLLPIIDYDKCIKCHACSEKCPTNAIILEKEISKV